MLAGYNLTKDLTAMPLKLKGILRRGGDKTYTFRIRNSRPNQAVDDLTQDALAGLHAFVVADKPTPGDHLFIVSTSDDSVRPSQILEVLNERFDLNAEFLVTGEQNEETE